MAISNNKSKTKVDYTAEGKNHYKTPWDNEIKTTNTLYDGQVKSINEGYDTKVFEQGRAYEDQYRENAVQKAINERQVAESMANLGLRDSGLNRTQQTAVQLSYGNNKASIDRQRQAGIDSLEFSRRQSLDTIEQNRTAAIADINQYYNNLAIEYGEGLKAKDEAAAESKKTEAKNLVLSFLEIGAEPPKDILALSGMSNSEIKAYKNYYNKLAKATTTTTKSSSKGSDEPKYKVRTAGGNGFDENGNEVYYFYDENGTKKTYPKGTNPYTGKPITGGYTAKELKEFGVWNGYQPKGVKYNGKSYGKVSQYLVDGNQVKIDYQGHSKTIWQTKDKNLWVWDDEVGNYVIVKDKGNGDFDIIIEE